MGGTRRTSNPMGASDRAQAMNPSRRGKTNNTRRIGAKASKADMKDTARAFANASKDIFKTKKEGGGKTSGQDQKDLKGARNRATQMGNQAAKANRKRTVNRRVAQAGY